MPGGVPDSVQWVNCREAVAVRLEAILATAAAVCWSKTNSKHGRIITCSAQAREISTTGYSLLLRCKHVGSKDNMYPSSLLLLYVPSHVSNSCCWFSVLRFLRGREKARERCGRSCLARQILTCLHRSMVLLPRHIIRDHENRPTGTPGARCSTRIK